MRRRSSTLLAALALAALISTAATSAFAAVPVEPGAAKPVQFEPASSCGCHTALVEQWTKSMHSQALSDPLYKAKLEEAQKATKGAIGPFCLKCHGPAATMTGEVEKDTMSAGVAQGISCSWCHQVVGNKGAPANTSQVLEPDGTRRAQIKDPQAPHKAAYSAFHESAEFCGGCHNVLHPVNGMHLEASYAEWQKSPYAKEGVTCQDCHMSRAPGVIGPSSGTAAPGAPERPNIYRMTFTGAQVELGDSQAATAMLKSAATVKLEAPEVLEGGSTEVTVTITNKGAGHYLPTGLTEVREMWLEVFTEAEDGTKTKVGERKFGTILQDDKGNAPVELWEATKIKSDDRIPPRKSVTDKFAFTMPAGAESATLKAALYYRSSSDELAKKAGVQNPTTEMAADTKVVYASVDAARDAAREDATQGVFRDGWNLAFALIGMAAIFGLIALFVIKSRRPAK